mmetsp:Transcript_20245/g.80845  ORF Transcript_20245/g.80845 Transcript_20245/m.80845 type:complete len:729 (-) Transcript_20245:85-2271(-)
MAPCSCTTRGSWRCADSLKTPSSGGASASPRPSRSAAPTSSWPRATSAREPTATRSAASATSAGTAFASRSRPSAGAARPSVSRRGCATRATPASRSTWMSTCTSQKKKKIRRRRRRRRRLRGCSPFTAPSSTTSGSGSRRTRATRAPTRRESCAATTSSSRAARSSASSPSRKSPRSTRRSSTTRSSRAARRRSLSTGCLKRSPCSRTSPRCWSTIRHAAPRTTTPCSSRSASWTPRWPPRATAARARRSHPRRVGKTIVVGRLTTKLGTPTRPMLPQSLSRRGGRLGGRGGAPREERREGGELAVAPRGLLCRRVRRLRRLGAGLERIILLRLVVGRRCLFVGPVFFGRVVVGATAARRVEVLGEVREEVAKVAMVFGVAVAALGGVVCDIVVHVAATRSDAERSSEQRRARRRVITPLSGRVAVVVVVVCVGGLVLSLRDRRHEHADLLVGGSALRRVGCLGRRAERREERRVGCAQQLPRRRALVVVVLFIGRGDGVFGGQGVVVVVAGALGWAATTITLRRQHGLLRRRRRRRPRVGGQRGGGGLAEGVARVTTRRRQPPESRRPGEGRVRFERARQAVDPRRDPADAERRAEGVGEVAAVARQQRVRGPRPGRRESREVAIHGAERAPRASHHERRAEFRAVRFARLARVDARALLAIPERVLDARDLDAGVEDADVPRLERPFVQGRHGRAHVDAHADVGEVVHVEVHLRVVPLDERVHLA